MDVFACLTQECGFISRDNVTNPASWARYGYVYIHFQRSLPRYNRLSRGSNGKNLDKVNTPMASTSTRWKKNVYGRRGNKKTFRVMTHPANRCTRVRTLNQLDGIALWDKDTPISIACLSVSLSVCLSVCRIWCWSPPACLSGEKWVIWAWVARKFIWAAAKEEKKSR